MKWQDLRQSDNVEVDCLGERTNLKSPEAAATIACQNEVTALRQSVVKGGKTEKDQDQLQKEFDEALGLFLDRRNDVSPSHLMGTDQQKLGTLIKNAMRLSSGQPDPDGAIRDFKQDLPKLLKEVHRELPPQHTTTTPWNETRQRH